MGSSDAAVPLLYGRLLKVASANNIRVKMIGDRTRFDQDIIDGINRLEAETKLYRLNGFFRRGLQLCTLAA